VTGVTGALACKSALFPTTPELRYICTDFFLFIFHLDGFIDVFTPDRSSATKTEYLYLAIILPAVVVFLLVIALVLWFLCRRKRRCVVCERNRTTNKTMRIYSDVG
jgi:heme/copper-type cytochrome/quinol oxidase subunit 2